MSQIALESAMVFEALAAAGTFAFAVSGALLAARHRLDIIGFLFVANITGVGGGTVRDLLLDVPVFWVEDARQVLLCSTAAVLCYLGANQFARLWRALLWADAVGLALFAVLGAQKALLAGVGASVAVVMGVFTACLGGIIRDVTLNDPPIIMNREIYISATLIGAFVYVLLAAWRGADDLLAVLAGMAAAFLVRALAITHQLRLPAHRGVGNDNS